ncbi:hypothetical protein [Stygiolobus caldivivus]|uniref:Uncharacterized protein n=1 Tax=Stygiolobus caldivivus TaxID=2824673 RepID=A0A8D5U814_9CREN|nr:hypothetical protein [Stygiolobus caldivivus]BCU71485.1 hypothetical protein KN1_27820 [Stygiolobus caldivivus]
MDFKDDQVLRRLSNYLRGNRDSDIENLFEQLGIIRDEIVFLQATYSVEASYSTDGYFYLKNTIVGITRNSHRGFSSTISVIASNNSSLVHLKYNFLQNGKRLGIRNLTFTKEIDSQYLENYLIKVQFDRELEAFTPFELGLETIVYNPLMKEKEKYLDIIENYFNGYLSYIVLNLKITPVLSADLKFSFNGFSLKEAKECITERLGKNLIPESCEDEKKYDNKTDFSTKYVRSNKLYAVLLKLA